MQTETTVEELEAAIKKLKSGKAPGRDNIRDSATVVVLPKPNKPVQDPKSYRPISLLCVPFKILERLIHSRINPVVDPQLPREQAGLRRGR